MIQLFSLFIAATIVSSPSQEFQNLLKPLSKEAEDEARAFIKQLTPPQENQQKKCSFSSSITDPSPSTESSNGKLLCFISFSVPLESWKEHSYFLEQTGGSFVLRGLPENSFPLLSQKLLELRKAGVYAEILLDPPSFEKYQINTVPTILLIQGDQYDKVFGNIRLTEALRLFVESGENKEFAQKICKNIIEKL